MKDVLPMATWDANTPDIQAVLESVSSLGSTSRPERMMRPVGRSEISSFARSTTCC